MFRCLEKLGSQAKSKLTFYLYISKNHKPLYMKNAVTIKTIYVLSAAFLVWGIFGLLDVKNEVYSGFKQNKFKVVSIEEDSPAARAGFQVGDVLLSSDGISIENYKEQEKRPREKVGQERTYVVERDGVEQNIVLTYAGLPQKNKTNRYISFVIGLFFILLPSVLTAKNPSALKVSLGLSMTTFGFLFLNGPYFSNGTLRDLVDVLGIVIITFALTYLADYLLKYAPESKIIAKKGYQLMFLPMVLIVVIVVGLTVIKPDYSASLNSIVQGIFTLFFLGYLGTSIITLIRKFVRTEPALRKSHGLGLMLLGVCFSLLPLFILFTINAISPGAEVPGEDYIFFGFALIPITFSVALNRYVKAT
jgi:hypothetical protein